MVDAPDQLPDREVVARVAGGERDAFRLLVRRYQDMLFRHALRMTGEHDVAADLVQASFVKAYTNLARCRDPERFGAWLYRILANACKDHLKSKRRKDVSIDDQTHIADLGVSPAADLERAQLRTQLNRAVAALPDSLREAFIMKHVEGRSYEEMAELLETSVPALKMRVHRAREALKEHLERQLY
jgi:RNA polymerase sigma-70 factor (ECF subfamily)